ncbi:MAG: type I-C CRISPR-associated protein Cas7/Csd2 [Bellilinea sp.]|jgi:CRISPR-associated protein Csd2
MSLSHKIDFAVVFTVRRANPNGDPLNGNRPRADYDGYGEVSDVCLKRKLRNRLQDLGENIFVQSDDNRRDEHRSLNARFEANKAIAGEEDKTDKAAVACRTWYDVRAFGQVFAFKSKSKKKGKSKTDAEGGVDGDDEGDSVSIGVRGPVTIQSAFSVEPVDTSSVQITKSVNLETESDPNKRGSDTMGMKHRVDYGVYRTFGSINCQLAEKTGFNEADATKLLEALKTMFVNDASAARPEGSMEVVKVIWWKHNCRNGQYSSAKVHRTVKIDVPIKGGTPKIEVEALAGLEPLIFDGE